MKICDLTSLIILALLIFSSCGHDKQFRSSGLEPLENCCSSEYSYFDLTPWIKHSEVLRWVQNYQGKGRLTILRSLQRGQRFRPLIEAILADYKLPVDFYYLALIESSFVVHARSHAGAVGIWQFMPATGTRYGLRINSYVDERKDPIRATVAAANLIADLYSQFQSWFLAMSAYSAGEGRVMRGIQKIKTRDFWKLSDYQALPKETQDYIPKFIAASWVAKNIEVDAHLRPDFLPPLQGFKVAGGVRLRDVASAANTSVNEIKQFNPHLLREVIPPGPAPYVLWFPKKMLQASVCSKLSELKPSDTKWPRKLKSKSENTVSSFY